MSAHIPNYFACPLALALSLARSLFQPLYLSLARVLSQVKMTAAATPGTTVWVYRCSIYAYPWYTSVRTILDDPAYAAWFLDFKPEGPWRSPKCDNNFSPPKCSDHYHMQEQSPGFPHGDGDCTCPVLLGIFNRRALVSWLPVGNPIETGTLSSPNRASNWPGSLLILIRCNRSFWGYFRCGARV